MLSSQNYFDKNRNSFHKKNTSNLPPDGRRNLFFYSGLFDIHICLKYVTFFFLQKIKSMENFFPYIY